MYLSVPANFPRESSSSFPYDGERQVLEFFLAAPATLSTTVTADTCLSRCRLLTVSPTLSTAFTRGRCYAGCCWDLFNVSVRSTRTTLEQTGFYPVSVITVDSNVLLGQFPFIRGIHSLRQTGRGVRGITEVKDLLPGLALLSPPQAFLPRTLSGSQIHTPTPRRSRPARAQCHPLTTRRRCSPQVRGSWGPAQGFLPPIFLLASEPPGSFLLFYLSFLSNFVTEKKKKKKKESA